MIIERLQKMIESEDKAIRNLGILILLSTYDRKEWVKYIKIYPGNGFVAIDKLFCKGDLLIFVIFNHPLLFSIYQKDSFEGKRVIANYEKTYPTGIIYV